MSREPVDKLPDEHAELRQRLALHAGIGGPPGALDRIAKRTSLSPDTVAAFVRGSHIAPWVALRLAHALDQDAGERGGRDDP